MTAFLTGTNRGLGGLRVDEADNNPSVFGVNRITVTNGTLTDNGNGHVTITTGGGGGGSGTVTSITNAADSGTGTAITTSGTFTYTGGTNITTAVSGTTVTINSDSASTVAAGSTNQVAYYTGANALGGDTGLTYTPTPGSRRLTIEDTSTGTMFELKSTDAGGGSAPDMVLVRDSSSPLAGDDLGVIVFKGNNLAGTEHEYARISSEADTVTAGAEDGQLDFRVFSDGSIGNQMRITKRNVNILMSDSTGNDSLNVLTLERRTTGTPAAGIGVGLEFEVETDATGPNMEKGAVIEAITTDVSSGSEDFDLVFRLMAGGATAAERMKLTSTGALTTTASVTSVAISGTTSVTGETVTSGSLTVNTRGTAFGPSLSAAGATDLTTLGFSALSVPANTIYKSGAGTTLTIDDAALVALPDGTRITITALEPGVVVFESPIYGGAISAYDLSAPGDGVTIQSCAALGPTWLIISSAGTAAPA